MKIGVSSYSFQQLISTGTETQLSIMQKAKDMGFDGIEFIDLSAPKGMSEAEYATLIREESEKLSLPVIAYTIGANLLGERTLDEEVERVCKKVDIAEILGAKNLRHDAAWSVPAAKRNKIDKIFLSKDNKRDVEWLDKELIEGIEFVFVDNYLEIFKEIFK